MRQSFTLRRMRAAGPDAVARRRQDRHIGPGLIGRRIRQALLPLLLALPLASPAWAGTTATRIEVLLHGMDCSLCVQGLEQRLRALPGAEQVLLDLAHGRLSLQVRAGSTVADQTLRDLLRNAGIAVRQIRRMPVAP